MQEPLFGIPNFDGLRFHALKTIWPAEKPANVAEVSLAIGQVQRVRERFRHLVFSRRFLAISVQRSAISRMVEAEC
ncbi:MAG: hypothetical protein HY747_09060 [Elusimicrobia bacterium]|nr:hypothetical protein [Elusimicrobiota bacterium]